jgi:transcriptional regulator with XRE-family HTH domain
VVDMMNEALRLLRVFHDLKSVELASQLKISTSYLSELESGKKTASLDILQRYADAFDTSPSTIMVMAEGLEKEPKKMKAKLSRVFVKFLQEIETQSAK